MKDNHLAAEQDLKKLAAAIRKAKAQNPSMKIEVEADNLEQVRALVQMDGVDVILSRQHGDGGNARSHCSWSQA